MKKIEIQAIIGEHLNRKPIQVNDLLNKSIKLNSYDAFMQEFHYIENTFKGILEFSKIAQEYINKMNSFIDSCNFDNTTALKNYITANLHNKICGYSNTHITIGALSSASINKSAESSLSAIQQIYDELGYSHLKNYIELIKTPSNFTSYINSSDKQLVAMHYLLFKTNHHSSKKLQRNLSVEKFYKMTQENLSSSLSKITSEKDDFVSFMNNEKLLYKNWYKDATEKAELLHTESKSEYQTFLQESRTSIEQLKKTYSDELKLKDPAEFMKEESEKYKKSARNWSIATVVLTIVLLLLLYLILDPEITFTKKLITINFFSNQMPVYSSVIIFSMVGLVIYIIRLFIKMAVSSKHLSEEYYQKYSLTYFYLSLLFEGKLEQRQADVILATLFTKADTGLLKNDTSTDTELVTRLFSLMKE